MVCIALDEELREAVAEDADAVDEDDGHNNLECSEPVRRGALAWIFRIAKVDARGHEQSRLLRTAQPNSYTIEIPIQSSARFAHGALQIISSRAKCYIRPRRSICQS